MTRGRSPAARALAVLALLVGVSAPVPARAGYPERDAGYHDYQEMVDEIHQAEADHPDIVRVFAIGSSYKGRTIWAVEVSDNVGADEGEPEVMLDALHHAREHLTPEMALYALHLLTDSYGADTEPRPAGHRPGRQSQDLDRAHGEPRWPGVRPEWRSLR